MKFSIYIFLIISIYAKAAVKTNDTIVVKNIYGYGCLTVPENKTWKIKKVTASFGGYGIIANCIKLKTEYKSGEKICNPAYCADADLVKGAKDSESDLVYMFEIYEY